MQTCAYCGSAIQVRFCIYCEMELLDKYILEDGERIKNSIEHYPEMQGIFKSTKELMELETIELICLLHHARNYRSDIYKLRILTHKAEEQGNNMTEINTASYRDYEDATRKVWVLENIIKDRVGYFPNKVTEDFLERYLERIEKSQKKNMIIKIAIKK